VKKPKNPAAKIKNLHNQAVIDGGRSLACLSIVLSKRTIIASSPSLGPIPGPKP